MSNVAGHTKSVPYSDIPGFKPWMVTNARYLRKVMLEVGFDWSCQVCSITEWCGQSAPLQIDHINGDRANNTQSNLRFLCPNCHAQTPTFAGKSKSAEKTMARLSDEIILASYDAVVSSGLVPSVHRVLQGVNSPTASRNSWVRSRVKEVCAANGRPFGVAGRALETGRPTKISWPSDESLAKMLSTMSRLQVSKKLGISDNAIKKRCAARGLVEPSQRRSVPRKRTKNQKVSTAESRKQKRLDKLSGIHGTNHGYSLEQRMGIGTCAPCKKAHSEYCSGYLNRKVGA